MYAEAVLFVDNDEPQPVEFNLFLKQCVRANGKHGATFGNSGEHNFPLFFFLITGQPRNLDIQRAKQRAKPGGKLLVVLLGKNLGWGHQCGLVVIFNCL